MHGEKFLMRIIYPEIGICGLVCKLCPSYHSSGKSRCSGCKSEYRMKAGCPFITCAIKKKGVEFCWQCEDSETCCKWSQHRKTGKTVDSFKCYQTLENDIAFIQDNGIDEFKKVQEHRELLLKKMLTGFNEGRSKSYYCIAASVMEIGELENALSQAEKESETSDLIERAKILHGILDEIAGRKMYFLKLRKL
jgi:hypothetical protein